jgi:hypothetical protein
MNLLDLNTMLDQFLLAAPEQRLVFENLGIGSHRDRNRSLAEVCRKGPQPNSWT